MASSRASSVTLADESIHEDSDIDVPMDIDSDNEDLDSPREIRLPDDYFNEIDVSPKIRAAQPPDSCVLKAVQIRNIEALDGDHDSRHSCAVRFPYEVVQLPDLLVNSLEFSGFGGSVFSRRGYPDSVVITTPLMEAIRGLLPESVEMLLDAKADPNGIPLRVSEMYAAFFLRFRPAVSLPAQSVDVASRDTLLSLMDLHQLSTLTREEVEDRFYEGVAPFWCEEGFVRMEYFEHGESMPSLVEAARSGSIEIFDRLVSDGADRSFWMRPHIEVPIPPTSSSLSVSSPIHAALQTRNNDMLEHLLNLGFDCNTMPLANPTRCFTPAMATIIYNTRFNKIAFDILCHYSNLNLELRTPVYKVHILHFAVATLDLDLLKHVSAKTSLHNAGETALDHTLLHVACMPANASQVQRHSELVCKSINECRDLRAQNDVHSRFPNPDYPDPQADIEFEENERKQQTAMIQYLWGQGIQNLEARDVHGNTALHYLAGCREINWNLLEWWWTQPGVKVKWEEAKNRYGASPEELSLASQRVKSEEERDPGSWRPWFESWWKVGRETRKRKIWQRLLDNDKNTKSWVAWDQDGD